MAICKIFSAKFGGVASFAGTSEQYTVIVLYSGQSTLGVGSEISDWFNELLNIVEGKKEAGSQTQDIAGLSRQYSATEPQLTDLTISHNILYLQREARCSEHVST